MARVVITGVGAISPLANTAKESWKKLLDGNCGIKRLNGKSFEKLPCRIAATVDDSNLKADLISNSERKSLSRASLFTLYAADEAVRSANLINFIQNKNDGFGASVGVGMIDLQDIYTSHEMLTKSYSKLSPFFIPRVLPNMAAGHISMKYGLRGPVHSVSTACATGAHSIGDAFRFIKYGDADLMMCGSGEASIEPLTIAGFCRLRALCTSCNDNPRVSSRPFDSKRDGFVIGEGAAILILEKLDHARRRNAPIIAEILGYGLSGDASHLTAPSEEGTGAILAMRRALKEAGANATDISYVNAHATSTPLGDKIEAKAIHDVFSEHTKNLRVSSTKGSHGHLLGAAGSLESVFLALACRDRVIPPCINLNSPDDAVKFIIPTTKEEWIPKNRRISLKNSFGFGGTNACLCISEYV